MLVVVAVLVLTTLLGAYGYIKYQLGSDQAGGDAATFQRSPSALSSSKRADRPADEIAARSPADTFLPVSPAKFSLTDISGKEILATPVAILASGWFAAPRQSCIGGYIWKVRGSGRRQMTVEGGILHNVDPVGLWQLAGVPAANRPELVRWTPNQPLFWQPLDGRERPIPVQTDQIDDFSDYARIPFNDQAAPGLFVQNKKVVGWSFGRLLSGGYLWTGNSGAELIQEFYTEDFYRLTFQDGREELLLLALSNESLSDIQQLEALIAAYRVEPRLPAKATFEHIRPALIQNSMRDLIARIRDLGRMEEILPLFDAEVLAAIDYPPLEVDLITIAIQTGEFEEAMAIVNGLERTSQEEPSEQDIAALRADLYRRWLSRLIDEGEINEAWALYEDASNRLPRDPAIRLSGVELALRYRDWTLAENLLTAGEYPFEWRETASRLQQEISEMKSQEGKIVIRYQPGSRQIPVTVRLDRRLNQRFLIDTGASIVTIPSATARRLGIDDQAYRLPRRLFYSATGVHNAIEVTLPYIDLDGWVINDVKALVVDLPGQPGVGLLGMNYLSNFQMEVNTAEGLLTLEPL